MDMNKLIDDPDSQNVLLISRSNLDDLLAKVIVIKEENTLVSDMIRVLKYKEKIFIQELTDKNEVALRSTESLESAMVFVRNRMETYEKMWDGCGCKINYYK